MACAKTAACDLSLPSAASFIAFPTSSVAVAATSLSLPSTLSSSSSSPSPSLSSSTSSPLQQAHLNSRKMGKLPTTLTTSSPDLNGFNGLNGLNGDIEQQQKKLDDTHSNTSTATTTTTTTTTTTAAAAAATTTATTTSSSSSSSSSLSNDKVPKKRGRPKLFLGDQEAADRRREQVRAAQQAYRLRKEKAITDLTVRVAHLEKTISHMNQCFLEFQTSVRELGVLSSRPELAVQLQKTQHRLMRLAADVDVEVEWPTASLQSGQSDSVHPVSPKNTGTSTTTNIITTASRVCPSAESFKQQHQHHGQPPTTSRVTAAAAAAAAATTTATATTTTAPPTVAATAALAPLHQQTTAFNISTGNITSFSKHVQTGLPSNLHAGTDAPSIYIMPLNGQSIPMTTAATTPLFQIPHDYLFSINMMNLPITRSHGSAALLSDFATRIFRVCLEKAIYVLRDDSFPTSLLQKIFGPIFGNITKQQLTRLFVHRLQTGMVAVKPVNVDAPLVRNWTASDWAMALGLEGKWLFLHEVEPYLLQRGINVTANSSYAWINPELFELNDSYQPSVVTKDGQAVAAVAAGMADNPYDSSGFSAAAPHFAFASQQGHAQHQDQHQSQQQQEQRQQQGGNSQALLADFNGQGQADWWKPREETSTPLTRSLALDVDRFISDLTNRTICLGRVPGFNQRDIDAAIAASIIQSF